VAGFEFNVKQAAAEEKILSDPLYQGQRDLFVELIRALRDASSPQAYWDLQFRLITQLMSRQKIAAELDERADLLRTSIKQLTGQSPKPLGQIKACQRLLDLTQHQRRVSEAIRWLLISVGDGLAWKVLGYDRATMTVLGRGTRVARFAGQAGFAAELTVIEELWQKGTFALHNDMTSCLRHGDVTAIHSLAEAGKRPQVEIIEVKLSHAASASSPQMVRLDEATRLLNEGRVVAGDGSVFNVHRVDRPYSTHLATVAELLPKARKTGYVARKVGDCHWVAIFFLPLRQADLPALFEENRKEMARLHWPGKDQKGVQWFTGARRARDRRFSFAYLAPLSIYPFTIEDVVDVLMGYMEIQSCLSGSRVEDAFRRLGTPAQVTDPPDGDVFLTAHRLYGEDLVSLQAPSHVREQMLSEFTAVECTHGLTRDLLDHLHLHPGLESHSVVPGDERAVWESSAEKGGTSPPSRSRPSGKRKRSKRRSRRRR
jgi:hypothetical protein